MNSHFKKVKILLLLKKSEKFVLSNKRLIKLYSFGVKFIPKERNYLIPFME